MSKVLIVGHSSSRYKKLEEILQICGMAEALPSHLYGMLPQQISAKLIQASHSPKKAITQTIHAHGINYSHSFEITPIASSPYAQKQPKKMWDNLAFDLLLANIEQPLWGWADDKAVQLLEYWAQYDDEIIFVLAYDKPNDIVSQLLDNLEGGIDKAKVRYKLQEWVEYNQALLDFYHKYSHRCMLVNGEQVINSAQEYVQSIAQKIEWQADMSAIPQSAEQLSDGRQVNPLIDFFVNQIIQNDVKALTMFSYMQQSADFPLIEPEIEFNEFDLLQQVLDQKNQVIVAKQQLVEHQKILDDQKNIWQQQLTQAQDQQKKDKQVTDEAKKQLQVHQQENRLVVAQLHQVQEELEKYYLQNQQDKEKLNVANQEIKSFKAHAETNKKQLNEMTQAKQQLEKQASDAKQQFEQEVAKYKQQAQKVQAEFVDLQDQLKKLQNNQNSNSDIKQENNLLIAQLHQVQEELEKYYLENQRLKTEQDKPKQPQPVYYGAAERVKQDLPYRLGSTMVSHSKSTKDLAKLPFALAKEYQAFKRLDESQQELPSLEEYQDADEAEKVKKHLSYKLGKTLVDGVKSPKSILDLPVKIGKEIVGFKKK